MFGPADLKLKKGGGPQFNVNQNSIFVSISTSCLGNIEA